MLIRGNSFNKYGNRFSRLAMIAFLSALAICPAWAFQRSISEGIRITPNSYTNLLENGGFEMGTLVSFNDGAQRGELKLTSDPRLVRSGAYAMAHKAKTNNSFTLPWNGSARQTYKADTTYRLTAWVKAAYPNTRVRLFVFALKNGQTTSPYWTGQSFTIGTEWQEINVSQYAPPGYDQVAVRLDNRDAEHTVYWDDLRLEPLFNAIPNPGFESLKIPFSRVTKGSIAVDATQAHKGTSSLKHTATDNDSYTLPYHGKGADLINVTKGQVVRLSAWVKANSTSAIQLRIFGLNNYNVIQNSALGTYSATTNWKKFTLEYTVPDNVSKLSIRLDNDGGAGSIVWWDDLLLEPVHQDTSPKVTFTLPVERHASSGDTIYLGRTHQRGRDGWFDFEIPGDAVHMNWVQIQGPIKIVLTNPRPTQNGFAYTGIASYIDSEGTRARSQSNAEHDFTAEFNFEVDGKPLSFFVKGAFKFLSWDLRIFGSGFDIELDDFGQDHHFDLEITNFDFSEDLIIPVLDLTETVWQSPFGIDTIFFVHGVEDPDGIDPFGVVLVPPGGTERIPITLRADPFAEAGAYEAQFIGVARNGGTETAELTGTFRRSNSLDINNISVAVFPGPAIPNNSNYELPDSLNASGTSISFDIKNFNMDPVIIEEPTFSTLSAPDGSNLEFVPDGPIRGTLNPNGDIIVLSGSFVYDEATTAEGNFSIDVTFLVTDTDGGFVWSDFYSFTISGSIGSSNPCEGNSKRGSDVCEGPLLVRKPNGDALTTDSANTLGEIRAEYFSSPAIEFPLKVKNITQGVCVIQSGTISGQGYSLQGGFPMTLNASQEADITVVFNTQSLNPNTYDGLLTLTHDDGTVMSFTLSTVLKPILGIRLFDEGGAPLAFSTNKGSLRGTFDFTPGEPMELTGREFKSFIIANDGNRPVRFKSTEIELDQEVISGVEFYRFVSGAEDPVIMSNGETQFAIEFTNNTNNTVAAEDILATLSLPFEVTEGEPDSETLHVGLSGDVGSPARLQIEACAADLCSPGLGITLTGDGTETIEFTELVNRYTFRLENLGDSPLVITNIVVNSSDFIGEIPTQNFGRPLSQWSSKSFTVFFAPESTGSFSDDVRIEFDQDTNPELDEFVFGIAGQTGDVQFENDNQVLLHSEDLEFGDHSQAPGSTVRETVIVENFGPSPLQGTLTLSQLQGNQFSLSPGGNSQSISIPSGGQQTLEVVMGTGQHGTFSAEVSLNHNVDGPNPYIVTVSGSVGGGPGGTGNMRITHGPTTPVDHNSHFSFGETPVGVPVGKNFRIWNEGTSPLVIPRSNFQVPSGYQLIETPNGPIPPPDANGTVHWDNFSMRLKADNAGQFNGQVRINNTTNHSPNPYIINVEGSVGPQTPGPDGIRVTHGATEVPHLSLFPFGTTVQGSFIGKNFRIYNETNEPLTFPRAQFSVPPGYQLVETPNGPIPPPDASGTVFWDNFSIHLTADHAGTWNGQVSFVPRRPNGQSLETWRMNVTGNVDQDPICQSDTSAPTLNLTEPTNNAVLNVGNVWIRASASDSGSGVDFVRFRVNGSTLKTDSSAPYNVQWNAPVGTHTIKAEAFDNCGNQSVRTISVTVEDPCAQDQQGPNIGITNPNNGAQLDPGLINITASASDPSGVARVEFYVDGDLKRNDTEAPWTHGHWFTVQGTYNIETIAYDNCGNANSDIVTITITESGAPCDDDDVLPWGSITSPANNAVLTPGNTTITATASDNVNVLSVSFEIDGQVPSGATDLSPPYSFNWNATPGNHSMRLRILDVCGNIGYSSSISVTVSGGDPCATDNTAPSVNITVPQNGAQLEPQLIDIAVNATDNAGGSGMDRVEFYVNGNNVRTDDAPPWTHGHWFTTAGQQTITVKGYDQCGNVATDTVTFTITESGAPCDNDTQPPTGAVTNPTPNSVIMPGPITLRGTATDNVNVFAVSFVVDGSSPEANVDLAPPYEYTWNATPGVHTIHLSMWDSCDNIGDSPQITVTVLGSTPTAVPNFVGKINGQNIDGLVVNQTNPAINFTWDHASAAPGIERYHIVVQPHGGPWLYGPNPIYPATSHTLQTSDLIPGTSYSIHIRAKSNDGIWGPFVNGGSFTVQ